MTIRGNEIFYEFDPFELVGKKRPKGNISALETEIEEYVLSAVLDKVGDTVSPVAGHGRFKGLSKEYRKEKAKISSSVIPNLELTGDMLDVLEVVKRGNQMRLRIQGEEAQKADGHCNHSGRSKLPLRRFIPNTDETFKRDILKGIREIIEEFEDGQS